MLSQGLGLFLVSPLAEEMSEGAPGPNLKKTIPICRELGGVFKVMKDIDVAWQRTHVHDTRVAREGYQMRSLVGGYRGRPDGPPSGK